MALKRHRARKYNAAEAQRAIRGAVLVELECKNGCGNLEMVPSETKAVICAWCVQKMIDPDVAPQDRKKSEGEARPRGWQFMNHFVDSKGIVYSRGKIVEDVPKEKPTKVKKKSLAKKKSILKPIKRSKK